MFGHDQGGIVGQGVGRQGARIRAHHRGEWRIQADAGQRDPAEDVVQGEDAHRFPVLVHRDHGADAQLVHGLEYFPQRRLRRAGHRLASDEGRQRAGHRLLIAAGFGVLGLEGVFGLFQQVGDPPGAEIVEGLAVPEQLVEVLGRQFETEGVVPGPIGAGDAALGKQGTEGEALALVQFQPGGVVLGAHHVLLAVDHPLLDDVEGFDRARVRPEDDFPLAVVGQLEALGQPEQVFPRHAVERGESGEMVDRGEDEGVGRGHGSV